MKTFSLCLFGLMIGFVFPAKASQKTKETSVKLVLNWKAEPQFGGFYAADINGRYKNAGLTVSVLEGGAGMPSVQMVATGKAEFGIAGADEVVMNRASGGDVVALFAAYQTSPHAILTHAERGFKSMADVFATEGILAVQRGLPYVVFLTNKFANSKVRQVPYLGGVSGFLSDKKYSQQGFDTMETLQAEKQGAKVKSFLVSKEGFDPYLTVLIVRRQYLEKNEAQVKAMIEATRLGWEDYLKDPAVTNKHMGKINRTLTAEMLEASAKAQVPFIVTEETKKIGLGGMTEARWKLLTDQLFDMKIIAKKPVARDNFL